MHHKLFIATITLFFAISGETNAMNHQPPKGSKGFLQWPIRKRTNNKNEQAALLALGDLALQVTVLPYFLTHVATETTPYSIKTCLFYAAKNNKTMLFNIVYNLYMQFFKPRIGECDTDGKTLFEHAIENQNPQIAKTIIKSWTTNIFNYTSDSDGNNIFHKIFMRTKDPKFMYDSFCSTTLEPLLKKQKKNPMLLYMFCKVNNQRLTPIDIAFEHKLEKTLKLVFEFVKQIEIAPTIRMRDYFIEDFTQSAIRKKYITLISHVLHAFPDSIISVSIDPTYPVYLKLAYDGINPDRIIDISASKADEKKIEKLKKMYHPNFSPGTFHFWEQMHHLAHKPTNSDLKIKFGDV